MDGEAKSLFVVVRDLLNKKDSLGLGKPVQPPRLGKMFLLLITDSKRLDRFCRDLLSPAVHYFPFLDRDIQDLETIVARVVVSNLVRSVLEEVLLIFHF